MKNNYNIILITNVYYRNVQQYKMQINKHIPYNVA